MTILKILLLPVSIVFGFITWGRNKLYDWHFFSSKSYDIPIISVGNLSIGGTGKTPTTEYLVRLLKNECQIAILSRGYKRKTKGFVLAEKFHSASDIGDEPRQYKQKFEKITVAVDEDRCHGVETLLGTNKKPEVILLDDAFQHRSISPGLSIILTDYHNIILDNFMFPTGALREFKCGAKRADIIIVSKTPKIFSPIVKKKLLADIKPLTHQRVYFSFIKFLPLKPFKIIDNLVEVQKNYNTILLVTGIANPYPLKEHLTKMCTEIIQLNFPDHHKYSEKDLNKVVQIFNNIATKNKIIVTTEKDVMRFEEANLKNLLKDLPIYYAPIQFEFHKDCKNEFDKQILDYVKKVKRYN